MLVYVTIQNVDKAETHRTETLFGRTESPINVDYAEDGTIIGIEILNAVRVTSEEINESS